VGKAGEGLELSEAAQILVKSLHADRSGEYMLVAEYDGEHYSVYGEPIPAGLSFELAGSGTRLRCRLRYLELVALLKEALPLKVVEV
jgi:hypothetical protein